jgi:hypothetical protein
MPLLQIASNVGQKDRIMNPNPLIKGEVLSSPAPRVKELPIPFLDHTIRTHPELMLEPISTFSSSWHLIFCHYHLAQPYSFYTHAEKIIIVPLSEQ